MKKFIAVAAGLALAGTMATSAMAEVNFSGDARARAITLQDYAPGGSVSKLDSRVRLVVSAKAKGGATAKARIRMADGMWNGGQGATGNAGDDKNIYVDYAYINVPMGPVSVSAGRQVASFSKWFSWDGRKDRLKMVYKNAGTVVALFYDKNAELTSPATTTTAATVAGTSSTTVNGITTTTPVAGTVDLTTANVSNDWTADNDKNGYGIVVKQKLGADWNAKAIAVIVQDETPTDNNGIVGSVNVSGKAGPVGLTAEVSMKDYDNSADTQMGGFAKAVFKTGNVTIGGIAGMTLDGFMVDDDFGTHMIGNGNNTPITVAPQIGVGGDTVFGVGHVALKVSDALSMDAFLTFATIDDFADLVEISAGAVYKISDGAALTVAGGAVIPSWDASLNLEDDTMFGAYAKLEVKY